MKLGMLYPTPGHDCPGLIEALDADAAMQMPLRGMIAPASLKLGALAVGGLGAITPLRGMIAPASLKQARH